MPVSTPSTINGVPSLDKALQHVLSEFVRRTKIELPEFVELMRGQTTDDYRPNKRMLPDVLRTACCDYEHRDALIAIAEAGVRAPLTHCLPAQLSYPDNHKSAVDRYPVLVRNIRKEQDAGRCLVLDLDILELWPEVHISPFGVVDKGDGDPTTTGRVIHDLSFPERASTNSATDTSRICPPVFEPSDAIAVEILRQKHQHPDSEILLQAGDVSSAFRNVCTHSTSAYLFGGRLTPDNALVIDTSAAFGWAGSPASYGVVGDAIAYIHGSMCCPYRPAGPFNYYWADDHINILGLVFDSETTTVSMPETKITKARDCVRAALNSPSLGRSHYRSLLGRLRHVATCLRPARPFLQRLTQQERHIRRWQRIEVTEEMQRDLVWWLHILDSPSLNGVPLTYFHTNPAPDIVVEMDASDSGLCALVTADRCCLRYRFTKKERRLVQATKTDSSINFDINYRELLSCAFAVHAWGLLWSQRQSGSSNSPVHVQFRFDNTSAVAWQNKLGSRNPRAQTIIRLLSHWEVQLGLRFSASHIAGVSNRVADSGSRSFSNHSMDLRFHELTRGWSQVTPSLDVPMLEAIWLTISERTLLPTVRSPSIEEHSGPGMRGPPVAASNPR
eukprot:jgi/Phyca11/98350/e_gw1.2.607.1